MSHGWFWRLLVPLGSIFSAVGDFLNGIGGIVKCLKARLKALQRFWTPLGGYSKAIGRSSAFRLENERGLCRSKRNPKRRFSYLGAKCFPKRNPGGSHTGSRRRFKLKLRISQNFKDGSHNSLIVEISRVLLEVKNNTQLRPGRSIDADNAKEAY